DDEGDQDPLHPVPREAGGTELLIEEAAEEAGEQEEDRHPERVNEADERVRDHVGGAVPGRPGHLQLHEGDGAVEEEAQQHRRRAAGVESVKPAHYITTIARPRISPRCIASYASLT